MKKSPPLPLKVAVIGTINCDTVIRADGSKHEGFGGILYNLQVLSALCPDRARIVPVVKLGADRAEEIFEILKGLRGIELEIIRVARGRNNHCFLKYHDDASKSEVLEGWVGAVTRTQLKSIVNADVILVNFISGFDIGRDNLAWLSENSTGLIFMDFHSRTLGRREDGSRFLRKPRDWKEYLACANIAQMNECEFELLSSKCATEQTCVHLLKELKGARLRCLIVTRGAKGCYVSFKEGQRFTFLAIPAPKCGRVLDTTGCGDVFSAGFISQYLHRPDIAKSAQFATRLATWRTQFDDFFKVDFEGFRKELRSHETSVKETRTSS